MRGKRTYGGRPGQRVEDQGTWASQKHSKAGYGRPVDRGAWAAKTVKRPRQQPAHPQYANYWAPLTRKRHIPPHPAQSQHTNYWAPRTRKRHEQEHRPQRLTERSDPTQHAKGRAGDCPGPRKETTTRRTVTRGVLNAPNTLVDGPPTQTRAHRHGGGRHSHGPRPRPLGRRPAVLWSLSRPMLPKETGRGGGGASPCDGRGIRTADHGFQGVRGAGGIRSVTAARIGPRMRWKEEGGAPG